MIGGEKLVSSFVFILIERLRGKTLFPLTRYSADNAGWTWRTISDDAITALCLALMML